MERIVGISKDRTHQERLANLYTKTGDEDAAKAIWNKLVMEVANADERIKAIDRALSKQQFDLVVTLGQQYWTETPNDWRVAMRLAFAYWKLNKFNHVEKIALHLQTQPDTDRYKIPKPKTSNANNYFTRYPALLMRVNLASGYLSILTQSNSGIVFGGNNYYSPRSQDDSRMLATIMLSETARKNKKYDEHIAAIREKAKTDVVAMKQLVWIQLATRKHDEIQDVLQRLIEANPNDPEPRAIRVVGLNYFGQQGTDFDKLLPQLNQDLDWIRENRPKVAVWMSATYMNVLIRAGKTDEAKKEAKKLIDEAQNMFALGQFSYTIAQLNDIDLFGDLIAKLEELKQNSPNTPNYGWVNSSYMLQQYVQIASQQKKWDSVLAYFSKYMNATHPKRIRGTVLTTNRNTSYGFGYGMHSHRPNNNGIGMFPAPTEFLTGERYGLANHIYNGMKALNKTQDFRDAIAKESESASGINKQCWTLLSIYLDWWDGAREKSLERLAKFGEDLPGNMEIKLLQAQALAGTNEPEKALALLKNVFLPFGTQAKKLENMRLELAQRAGDEEAGKQASLRLFGMRLNSNEQIAVARAMRRWGLTARSRELMGRAVRTAANKPNELYQLMRNESDPKKAAGIAKTLLRQTRSNNQNNYSSYRVEAYRVLNRTGELAAMVKDAEEKLKSAPKSLKLLTDLSELYNASGNREKSLEMLHRISDVNPKDAKVAYQVAQKLFERGKLEDGIKKLETVWKYDTQYMLQNGYNIGRYYLQAKRLDLLSEHMKKLKGSPILQQNAYMLDNIVSNLRHQQGAGVDDVIKLYKVAIDISPENHSMNIKRQFGDYLVQKKREKEAFALYKELIIPKSDSDSPQAQNIHSYTTTSNGVISTSMTRFVDLAKKTDQAEATIKAINDAAAKNKGWAGTAELALAMFKRRDGDEAPIREVGNKFVNDKKFSTLLNMHVNTLRAELQTSENHETLRVALKVWTKKNSNNNVVYPSGYYDQSAANALATIYIKLGERDNARAELLKGMTVTMNGFGSSQTLESLKLDRYNSIASTLKQHKFNIEALDLYDRILRLDRRNFGSNGSHYLEWRIPETYRNLRSTVTKIVSNSTSKEEAFEELSKELAKTKGKPNLNGFFAAIDPASAVERQRYGSSRNKPTRAAELAVLNKQLLPALLDYAQKAKKLDSLAASFKKQQERADELKLSDRQKMQFGCLDVLLSYYAGDSKTASEKLSVLTKGIEDVDTADKLLSSSELWIVALATRSNKDLSPHAKQIATAVSKAAVKRSDSSRQRSAFLLITDGAEENSDKVLEQMLAKRKNDPSVAMQVGEIYLQRKQYNKAVDLFKIVWERDPSLITPKLMAIGDAYAKANRLKDLADGIRMIRDRELIQRYGYRFGEVLNKIPAPIKDVDGLVAVYEAALDSTDSGYHSGIANYFAQALRKAPQDAKTYEALKKAVLPTKKSFGTMRYVADMLLNVAKTIKKLDDLETATNEAIKEFGGWKSKGDFMLAMIDRKRDKEGRLNAIAEEYLKRPSLAAELEDVRDMLRKELTSSSSDVARNAALKMWEAQNVTGGYSTTAIREIAGLLVKLNKKQEARERLIAAADIDPPGNYDLNYRIQQKLQRKKEVASLLSRNGFVIDSFKMYSDVISTDLSDVQQGNYSHYVKRDANNEMIRAVNGLLDKKAEETLDGLIKTIREAEKAPDLDAYFLVFDTDVPSMGSTPTKKKYETLLLPLLKTAREKKKLAELSEATKATNERFPKNLALDSLQALITLTGEQPGDANRTLESSIDALSDNNKLAPSDALWLMARTALTKDQTRTNGQQLAEAIATQLSKDHRERQSKVLARLSESLISTGQADRANQLMQKLLGSSKDMATQRQLAALMLKRKDVDGALGILKEIWKQDPEEFFKRFATNAQQFANAGKMTVFVKSLRELKADEQQIRNHSYNMLNAANSMVSKKETMDASLELLAALAEVVTEDRRIYAYSNLGNGFNRAKRYKESYEVYYKIVAPPLGSETDLSTYAYSMVRAARSAKLQDKFETDIAAAIKKYPAWKDNGELCLAVLQNLDKKPDLLSAIGKRFAEDEAYAEKMKPSMVRFVSMLDDAKSKPILALAKAAYKAQIEKYLNEQNYGNYSNSTRLAAVQVKLDKRDDARKTLYDALDHPTPNYSANYLPYYRFQRREQIANSFDQNGFFMDAASLYRENIKMDVSSISKNYRMDSKKNSIRGKLRRLLKKLIDGKLDDALAALEAELKKDKDVEVKAYLWKFPMPWKEAEHKTFPAHVKVEGEDVTKLSFLTTMARHAKSKQKSAEIVKLIGAAKTKHPKLSKDLTELESAFAAEN